jgi:multidrug efflux pump subunit AcrB
MKKIIHFLTKQKLFVNLVVFLIFVIGLSTISKMNREGFPQVSFDMVSIKTVYPGGSPDELEKLVTIPIEKKLREVDGLDKVRSYNIENVSVIVIYIDMAVSDKDSVVQDIKDTVALVDNLPDKAEKSVVEEIKFDKTHIFNLAIYSKDKKVNYKHLVQEAENLENFLYDIEGVAEVKDFAMRDKEFLVEVSPAQLKRLRIGMNDIIYALQTRNLDLPGGVLRQKEKEFVLRTKGQFKNIKEVKNTVIMANDAGFITRIKDVAKVYNTFKEPNTYERLNGHNAIIFDVIKKKSADEIRLAEKIKSSLKTYKPITGKDIIILPFEQQNAKTEQQIESVIINAVTGFLLLAAILFVLLGGRMAMVVMISFPISFMIGFIGMEHTDITINVISLFGMIMVLGMIVDSGIVVTENSHRYLELGLKKEKAIQTGVSEVVWPLIVTLLCLTAAFMPLAVLTGIVGKFIRSIPIVVLLCLAASVVCALFIMPTHLNMFAKEPKRKKTKAELKEIEEGYEKGLFGKFQHKYRALLETALKHRYITLLILIGLFAGANALSPGFQFMPGGGEEDLEIRTYLPQETNLSANLKEIKKLETLLLNNLQKGELESIRSRVGIEDFGIINPQPGEGTHKSTLLISLVPEKERSRNATEIIDNLRKQIKNAQKNGLFHKTMVIKTELKNEGPPIGKPVNIEIRGKDFKVLKEIANKYLVFVKTIEGVYDAGIDLEPGKLEYRYKIDEVKAKMAGVSVQDAAHALHSSFAGAVATNVRKDEDDIAVRVQFPEKARKSKKTLNDVMVSNHRGGLIPLDEITSVEKKKGLAFINRLNFKRLIQVQASIDTKKTDAMKVNAKLEKQFKDIESRYPGYAIKYGGEKEDSDKSMKDLASLFMLALFIIYTILAVYFNSLMLPLVVMCAIPFSLVGVILAFWAHGQPMSFMSTLGIFSLAGVIVSNTLVLVQFINNLRDKKLPLKEALLEGGVIRLRPVLLTSGTTVLGLFPTIYGLGGKDYFVAPLSLAFGYGLIFATIITLLLIPCFYHIAEDIKSATSKLFAKLGIKMSNQIYHTKK